MESWGQTGKSSSRSLIYGDFRAGAAGHPEENRGDWRGERGAVHMRSQSAGRVLECSRPGPHGARKAWEDRRFTQQGKGQPALRTREQDAGKDKFSWRFRGKHRSEM